MHPRFRDRTEAGRLLAGRLMNYADRTDLLVLALPRGGVPVAYEIAKALNAPLDAFVVRKLGVPGHEELAMGALAMGGVVVLNREVIDELGIPQSEIDRVAAFEAEELRRRELAYRANRQPLDLRGRTVILVDDGLATGTTMRAAVKALRQTTVDRVVVAVPVAALSTFEELREEVDDAVCLRAEKSLNAISLWYENFSQTTDEEVRTLLEG